MESYALEMQQVEVNSGTGLPEVRSERWSVQYSGPATYVQVKGLRPGRNYAVRVVCRPIVTDPSVVVELADPSEILLVRTPATPPAAPTTPQLAVRQRNSLKYKWSEPSENGGHPVLAYVVQCHPPPEGFQGQPTPEGMFEIYRGLERSVVLKKLLPGVRYSVRVKAINCIGESPFSPVATYTTQASVPSTPYPPTVSSSGQDSVVLRWAPVSGNGAEVSGYQVMMDDGQGGEFNFIGHTLEPQFSVAGLRSGLSYRFRVQAENSEGRSQWSAPCVAQTAATPPMAPPPPARSSATHSSASIIWRQPEYDGGSPVQTYQLEMQPKCSTAMKDMSREWVRVFEGLETTCTLGGLRAGCMYRVRVRALNAVGAGAYSYPADVATSAASPEAPGTPAATSKAQDSLAVQWEAPSHDGGAPILSYRLCHRLVGPVEQPLDGSGMAPTEEESFHTAYDGVERRAEISGLSPGMSYEFKVNATNRQGQSPWSTSILATKAGLPLPPAPPSIGEGSTARSLELRWERPYGNGAVVDSYVVQMRLAETEQQQVQEPDPQQGGAAEGAEDGAVLSNGIAEKAEAAPEEAVVVPSEDTTAMVTSVERLYTTVYHSNEPCCTVNDLEPNTKYSFRIRAFNSIGASLWSEILTAWTAPAAPSSPENLRCAQTSCSALFFAWDAPSSDHGAEVTSYQLEFAPASRGQRAAEKTTWRSAYKGDALGHELTELPPGAQYRARVRATNSCGWGPWSEVVAASTEADVPGAPDAPVASGRTGTSVRLTWAPPLDNHGSSVTEYELQMAQGGADGQFATLVSGVDTNWKASQLAHGTEYAFRVRASNAVGAGPWSAVTLVTTSKMAPLEPTDVQTSVESCAGAVLVRWIPPVEEATRAGCTSYEIECISVAKQRPAGEKFASGRGGDGKPAVIKHTCSGKVAQSKVTGLKVGGEWSIRIRGIGADGAGHGEWSVPITVAVSLDGMSLLNGPAGAHHGRTRSSAASDSELAALPVMSQRTYRGNDRDGASVTSGTDFGGTDDGRSHGRGHRRGGSKTAAVAKAKPRPKTAWTTVAKFAGVSETTARATFFSALIFIVLLALVLTLTQAPADF